MRHPLGFAKISILILLGTFLPVSAYAVNAGITYHGRILKPDTTPVTDSAVQFKLQIRTPGSEDCLMYEETQTKDLSASAGSFSITLNDGSGTRTDSSGYSIDKIFGNRTSMTFTFASTCAVGTTYTPNVADGRKFSVSFKDSTMASWEPLPAQTINFVPSAIEAYQVGGFSSSSLLRVENGSGPQTVSSLTPAQAAALLTLSNGTSTQYVQSGTNGASLPSFASDPSTPAAGQVWYDSTNKLVKYYDGTSVQTVGASLPNVGTAGTYTKVTTDAQGRVTSGTQITGADITTGTIGGNTVVNTTGTITAASVSSGVDSTNSLRIWDGTSHKVTVTVPVGLAADYPLQLPGALPGANNMALVSSTGGVLSWMAVGTGNGDFMKDGSVAMTAPLKITPTALPGSPAAGTLTFDSAASNALKYYDGSTWQTVGTGTGSGDFKADGSVPMTGDFNAGGKRVLGNSSASANLELESTSNLSKGYVLLQKNGGNVGIGTNAPAELLHLYKPTANFTTMRFDSGAVQGQIFSSDNGTSRVAMGSITNHPVLLLTNDVERMRVDTAGNVGIGTATPSGTLDVEGGTAAAATNGTPIKLFAQNAGSGNQNGGNIILKAGNQTGSGTMGMIGIGATNPKAYVQLSPLAMSSSGPQTSGSVEPNLPIRFDFSGQGLDIGAMSSGGAVWIQNRSFANFGINFPLALNPNGGNVGVGTTVPNQLLTVEGPMSLRTQAAPTATASYGKVYVDSGDSNKLKYMDPAGSITNLSAAGTGASQWTTTGSDVYYNTGNVGIGTTTPLYPLHVKATNMAITGESTNSHGVYGQTSNASSYGVYGYNMAAGAGTYGASNTGIGVLGQSTSGIGGQFTSTTGYALITGTGNVGLGSATPAEQLDVNGNIKIGDATSGTIRSTKELVLRQDGDTYGPTILRLRNRNNENGAIFETTDPTAQLVDFIFKSSGGQRNIRFESRAANAKAGANSFHIGGSDPDDPTLAIGDAKAIARRGFNIVPAALSGSPAAGDLAIDSGALNALKYYNGSSWVSAGGGGSSQWTTTGSDIYYSTGKVGVGTATPTASLEVYSGDAKINGLTVGRGAGNDASSVAIGMSALPSNTSGAANVAIGRNAANSNTSGGGNVAIGYFALWNNSTSNNNTAVGASALVTATGANNTAIGYANGYDLTTGTGNILIGAAGSTNVGVTTGSNNILIGYDVRPPSRTGNGQLNIGNLIYATGLATGATASTGSVGIGTTAPNQLLTVEGPMSLRTQAAPTATASYGKVYVDSGDSNKLKYMDPAGSITNLSAAGTGASQWTTTGSDIYYTTGSVGIGTNAPSSKLHVRGNVASDVAITVENRSSNGGADAVFAALNDGGAGHGGEFGIGSTTYTSNFGTDRAYLYSYSGSSGVSLSAGGTGDIRMYTADTSEKLRIKSNGNVGIGTTNPNQLLTVEGPMSLKTQAAPTATANYGKIYVDSGDSDKLKYMNPAGSIVNLSAGGASQWTTSGSDIYYNTGSVGIGTSTPGEMLHLSQLSGWTTARLDSGSVTGYLGVNSVTSTAEVGTGSNNDFKIVTNTNERMRFTASGDIGIGTTTPTAPITIVKGANILEIDPTLGQTFTSVNGGSIGLNASDGGQVQLFTGDVVRAVVDASGNVGIGSTSPTTALDVNGTVKVKASTEGVGSYASSSTAYTIPDATSNLRRVSLTANTTITLPAFTATGTVYTLTVFIKQDTTTRTLAWAANGSDTILWDQSATAPPPSSGSGKITIYQFTKAADETTWYGTMVWKQN